MFVPSGTAEAFLSRGEAPNKEVSEGGTRSSYRVGSTPGRSAEGKVFPFGHLWASAICLAPILQLWCHT